MTETRWLAETKLAEGERRLVEAAGVEFERSAIGNFLMAHDFWWQFAETAALRAVRRLH